MAPYRTGVLCDAHRESRSQPPHPWNGVNLCDGLALRIRIFELGVGRYVLPDSIELTTLVHLIRYDGMDYHLSRDDGIHESEK